MSKVFPILVAIGLFWAFPAKAQELQFAEMGDCSLETGFIDSEENFLILVDAFGNGVSSSPSNSPTQPGAEFPTITIRDMVRHQHRFLTEVMGIRHLKAVTGVSMGGMQTFESSSGPSPATVRRQRRSSRGCGFSLADRTTRPGPPRGPTWKRYEGVSIRL